MLVPQLDIYTNGEDGLEYVGEHYKE